MSRGRSRAVGAVVAVLAAAGLAAVVTGVADDADGPEDAPATTLAATVSRVVDGDTVRVVARGAETTVRLVGIDTPETRHPGEPVQCFGPQASARAALLMPEGARVRLETDATQATRDRYGRLLAYVYREGRGGPRGSVNHALVAGGHARVYVYGGVPFLHAAALTRAERAARAARRGLWGPPCDGARAARRELR